MMFRLSIVIPVYRRTSELAELLICLANCCPDVNEILEVIVVENRVPHNKSWLLNSIWPFSLKYLFQETGNQSSCRNRGASIATGTWLLFIDSDVVLGPDGLAELIKTCQNSRNGSIVTPNIVPRAGVTRSLATRMYDVPAFFKTFRSKDPTALTFREFVSCAFAIRRGDFLRVEGFSPVFYFYGYEDVEFSFRVERLGMKFLMSTRAHFAHHKNLTPQDVLARAVDLGRSAVKLVALQPDLEDIMPVGVAEYISGCYVAVDESELPTLISQAMIIEDALVARKGVTCAEARGLIMRGRRIYWAIANVGRLQGIREELETYRSATPLPDRP